MRFSSGTFMLGSVIALSACASDPSTISASAQATEERDHDDHDDDFEARAERGLAISPVRVNLRGLGHRQRHLVGLGSYIINAASDCAACHSSPAGFLSGGVPFNLDPSGHVVWTRNLTPDPGTGLQLTLEQFMESMRTGRDFHAGETRMLVVMPWTTLRWSSDLDLRAIYAYLRAIPPVANVVPPDHKGDLPLPPSIPFPRVYNDGNAVRALRGATTSFSAQRGLAISPLAQPRHLGWDDRAAYGTGSYIVNAFAHCNDCHTHPDRTPDFARINTGAFLTGGTVFAVPPPLQPVTHQLRVMSANLHGAEHGFFSEPDVSYELFHDIIHANAHVDESPPRPLGFPMSEVAPNLARLTEEDLRAVYTYLSLAPRTQGAADQERQGYARFCAGSADCASGETCWAATHECVGRACGSDTGCDACQTCDAGHCQAPAPTSACLLSAQ